MECTVCSLKFKTKANYTKHLKTDRHRQRCSEVPPKTYSCICGRSYSYHQSLYLHRKTCEEHKQQKGSTTEFRALKEKVNTFERETDDLKQTIEMQRIRQEELKEQIAVLLNQTSSGGKNTNIKNQETKKQTNTNNCNNNTTNNTNNCNNKTNNTNNFNFNINVFGQENTEHIDNQTFVSIMDHVYKAIPLLVQVLHFDKDHPENNNIKITNKKLPYATVMGENKKWKTIDKKDAIENMMNNGYNLLDEKYDENKEELSAFKQQCFEDFQEKYENDDKKVKKQIKTEVELMVINESKDSK